MTEAQRIEKLLRKPQYPLPVVLDTDTYNEVDDQFCLTYAVKSDQIDLQAVYAAPFHNEHSSSPEDGMERSYNEILKIFSLLDMIVGEDYVFRGSPRYMTGPDDPVDSPAARDLIRRAMARTPDDPLYVVAIGCPVNVSSAILLEPEIIDRIIIVWLGGNRVGCWDDAVEFNLYQDLHASRILYDCGAPLVVMPTLPVVDHLLVTLPELSYFLKDASPIGQYLYGVVESWWLEHREKEVWSKVIWDIVTIGYLLHPDAVPVHLIHSPVLTDKCQYAVDESRHMIAEAYAVDRDIIFNDIYRILESPRLKQ